MSISISSAMTAGLTALAQTNDSIDTVKVRLNTGLAIASPSDNIPVYFKAQAFSTKADAYTNVNSNITQGLSNLDTVNSAMDNMKKSLQGALQLMKDARSKAVPQALGVKTNGDIVYANQAATASTPALTGKIVSSQSSAAGGTTPSDINDTSMFQVGDVFAITITDSANTGTGGTSTRYFRATSTNKPVSQYAQVVGNDKWTLSDSSKIADGSSQDLALNFNDMDSLRKAIQQGFGTANVTVNVNAVTIGPVIGSTLGFTLGSLSQSIAFQQVYDMAQGAGTSSSGAALSDSGVQFNFAGLFGKQQGYDPTSGNISYNTLTQISTSSTGGANIYSYSPVGAPKAALDDVLTTRKSAADFFRQTLYSLKNIVNDGALPGFANILKGDTMTVQLNDSGSVNQVVRLRNAVDPLSLGFAGFNESNGTVSVNAATSDFNTDASLDTAIGQINSAVSNLSQNQTFVAAAKTQMSGRLDFNKTYANTLSQAANVMTAADTAQESANLATLSNRQNFIVNNMSLTKQAEQSLIQLLR